MIERLAIRTAVFTLIIALTLGFMEIITRATGMPEVMQVMTAIAKVAAAEFTVLWMRIIAAPQLDMQKLAKAIEEKGTPEAKASLYFAYTAAWAWRFGAFVWFLEH